MAKWHTVGDGDSLVGLTIEAGFGSVDAIWSHPENAALRKARRNPWLLLSGDRIFIPDRQPGFRTVKTGSRHVFVLRVPRAQVRVRILYHDGTPATEHRYELDVEGERHEGVTDGEGIVEHRVPSSARQGKLTVWMIENDAEVPRSWELDLGHIEPLREVRGVQTRLRNLGIYHGSQDGKLDPLTGQAIQSFQEQQGIEPTGELDDLTYDALETLYGL